MCRNIISIISPERSGKKTLIKTIKRTFQNHVYLSFIDPVLDMIKYYYNINDIPEEDIYDNIGCNTEVKTTVKHLIKTFRIIHKDWFIHCLYVKMRDKGHFENPFVKIIDHCKFENDLEFIKKISGILIILDREGLPYLTEDATDENFLSNYLIPLFREKRGNYYNELIQYNNLIYYKAPYIKDEERLAKDFEVNLLPLINEKLI